MQTTHLDRFREAQATDYNTALNEIKSSRKRSHWMWYIFPQIVGLGRTETSRRYAIKDMGEVREYLMDEGLGLKLA